MSDHEVAMYKTITDIDGLEKAHKYYDAIGENINASQGFEDAMKFFRKVLGHSGYSLEDIVFVLDENERVRIYTKNEDGEYAEDYDPLIEGVIPENYCEEGTTKTF